MAAVLTEFDHVGLVGKTGSHKQCNERAEGLKGQKQQSFGEPDGKRLAPAE